jgi:N-acetylglucosamine-6-sulfatase
MSGTGLNVTNFFNPDAVFPTMRRAGYKTAIFGKIHNAQKEWLCTPNNHSEPFDHIETECSPCGGYYRTRKDDWVSKEEHGSPHVFETLDPADPFSNYSEAQYGNRTARWIRKMTEEEPDTPWFAFIGTSGPHLGVTPAPWHRERTRHLKFGAPRTPNFNWHAADHHPLLATQPGELTAPSVIIEPDLDKY